MQMNKESRIPFDVITAPRSKTLIIPLFSSRNLSDGRESEGTTKVLVRWWLETEQYHGDLVILMESSVAGAKLGNRKARTNGFNEIRKSQILSEAMTRTL